MKSYSQNLRVKKIHIESGHPLPVALKSLKKQGRLDFDAVGLIEAALKFGASVDLFLGSGRFGICRFTKGKKVITVPEFTLPLNSSAAFKIASNKAYTRIIWQADKIPTPRGFSVGKSEFPSHKITLKRLLANKVKFPVVVKPQTDTSGGKGVVTAIQNIQVLKNILKNNFATFPNNKMIIENYYGGLREYRVTLLNGRVIGLSQKIAPYVVGDGRSTIKALIAKKNKFRKRYLLPVGFGLIPDSPEIKQYLQKHRQSLATILSKGERATLSNVKNLSSGGEPLQLSKTLPSGILTLCRQAASSIGLRFSGLDILSKDIFREPFRGVFIEINSMPLTSMHYAGDAKQAEVIYRQLVSALFAERSYCLIKK